MEKKRSPIVPIVLAVAIGLLTILLGIQECCDGEQLNLCVPGGISSHCQKAFFPKNDPI